MENSKIILKNEFQDLGLQKDVIFHGVIPHNEVRSLMSQCQVLLFPTRVEAFGLVIAEAMMEGCVPIVTLLEGITDATVTNKKTGFLIEKDNIEEFCSKIQTLINDKDLYETLSKDTAEHAKKYLSLKTMGMNYDTEIKGLLSEK